MPGSLRRIALRWSTPLSFAFLAALFFWPLWAPSPADRMMIGPAEGDFLRQFYPYRAFVAGAWGSAHPPLWNPHQYAGTPALADPQLAALYPWRLLQIPLAVAGRTLPLWAVELEAVAHIALGAWFTFLLVRRLGASRWAAAFGGVVFAFGGYLTGYPVDQLAVLDTAVWLPATLWSLAGPLTATSAAIAAVATAMAVLAGHAQTVLYIVWAGVAWWAARAWSDARSGVGLSNASAEIAQSDNLQSDRTRSDGTTSEIAMPAPVPWRRKLAVAAIWLAGAAGLSAAQWLPSVDFVRRTARALDPAEVAAGLRVFDSVQLVAPLFARTWRPEAEWGSQWVPLYVGVLALPLVLWGAWRVRESRFWVGLAAFGWLVSLGGNSPVFPILLRTLPGMAFFRHQERAAILVGLGLAVAAGLALGRVVRDGMEEGEDVDEVGEGAGDGENAEGGGEGGRYRDEVARRDGGMLARRDADTLARLTAGLAAATGVAGALVAVWPGAAAALDPLPAAALADALMFTALVAALGAAAFALRGAGRISARALGAAMLALVVFDLFSVNRGNVLAPERPVFAPDAIVEALAPHARDGRVSSEALLPGGANAASVFRLYDVTGDSPLQLGPSAALIAHAPEIVWWRLLGVRYALTDRPTGDAPVAEIARTDRAVLYEVQLPAEPAWVPARVWCLDRPVGGEEAGTGADAVAGVDAAIGPTADADARPAIAADSDARPAIDTADTVDWTWARADFNPQEFVVVDRRHAQAADCDARTPRVTGATARLTALSEVRVAVDADLPSDGWLVLSMAYDPGWRARARGDDGRTLDVDSVPAYGAITAVRLPAGRWGVEWTYRPNAVIVGVVLNLLTLGLGLVWWRRRSPDAGLPR